MPAPAFRPRRRLLVPPAVFVYSGPPVPTITLPSLSSVSLVTSFVLKFISAGTVVAAVPVCSTTICAPMSAAALVFTPYHLISPSTSPLPVAV